MDLWIYRSDEETFLWEDHDSVVIVNAIDIKHAETTYRSLCKVDFSRFTTVWRPEKWQTFLSPPLCRLTPFEV